MRAAPLRVCGDPRHCPRGSPGRLAPEQACRSADPALAVARRSTSLSRLNAGLPRCCPAATRSRDGSVAARRRWSRPAGGPTPPRPLGPSSWRCASTGVAVRTVDGSVRPQAALGVSTRLRRSRVVLMIHVAQQLRRGRQNLPSPMGSLPSRTGRGGTYGLLWVIKRVVAAVRWRPSGEAVPAGGRGAGGLVRDAFPLGVSEPGGGRGAALDLVALGHGCRDTLLTRSCVRAWSPSARSAGRAVIVPSAAGDACRAGSRPASTAGACVAPFAGRSGTSSPGAHHGFEAPAGPPAAIEAAAPPRSSCDGGRPCT